MATNGRANNNLVARDEYGRWLKGFSGGPGRPVGSRKKLSEASSETCRRIGGSPAKRFSGSCGRSSQRFISNAARVIAQQAGVCAVGEAPPETEVATTSSV